MQTLLTWLALMVLGASHVYGATIVELSPRTYSVEDKPVNGLGDRILQQPFGPALIVNAPPDRTLAGFHLYDIPSLISTPADLSSAVLRGAIAKNNSLNTGDRRIEILLFGSDGTSRPSDFEKAASSVGTVIYNTSSIEFEFDVASQLRSIVGTGATHLGVKFFPVNFQAASVSLSESGPSRYARLRLSIVPEPAGVLSGMLGCAAMAWFHRRLHVLAVEHLART